MAVEQERSAEALERAVLSCFHAEHVAAERQLAQEEADRADLMHLQVEHEAAERQLADELADRVFLEQFTSDPVVLEENRAILQSFAVNRASLSDRHFIFDGEILRVEDEQDQSHDEQLHVQMAEHEGDHEEVGEEC